MRIAIWTSEEQKSPMLYTSITSRLFVEYKKTWLLHTLTQQAQKLWNKWELQLAVLFSLLFQILLISLGDHRRNIHRKWLQIILWIAYLCADWVAAVALGLISHSIEEPKTNELIAFWAPFLLLHLGGPDTITAYSLEDNNLWLRHLLGLVVQGSIALYVSVRSWTGGQVSILSSLMFVPAIIKYGERTWALSSASKEHFRDSLLGHPDSGPSYAKFMEEYHSKDEEGFRVTIGRIEEDTQRQEDQSRHAAAFLITEDGGDDGDNADIMARARDFFETFKRLFAFLILSHEDWEESKLFFQQLSYDKAYELVDIELGFMFDVLYTKAFVVYSKIGCVLRSVSIFVTIFVFVMFLYVDKHGHLATEISMTYVMLVVGIILEIFAAIILISSDWAFLWLRQHGLDRRPAFSSAVSIFRQRRYRNRRWSNYIAQYDLLDVWLKDKPSKFIKLLRKSLGIDKKIRKYWYTNYVEATDRLKIFIFEELRSKSEAATDLKEAKRLCKRRGGEVLKQNSELHDLVRWSIDEVEFDQSILIWHIATELCYHYDESGHTLKNNSKILSDYMMYLLVVCPFMLPEGIGEIRCLDTEKEARNFFKGKKVSKLEKSEACGFLREVRTEIPPIEVKGPKSKSVLFDACRLANQLNSSTLRMKKWETIGKVWVEMLSYAAAQCNGPNHAQQLGQGGELLTHVWLLMAHLGITEQFQMPTGFAMKLMYR